MARKFAVTILARDGKKKAFTLLANTASEAWEEARSLPKVIPIDVKDLGNEYEQITVSEISSNSDRSDSHWFERRNTTMAAKKKAKKKTAKKKTKKKGKK